MKLRALHRAFGIILFFFLVNASVTGVLRANAKWWYWKDRKPVVPEMHLMDRELAWRKPLKFLKKNMLQGKSPKPNSSFYWDARFISLKLAALKINMS